MMDNVMNTNEKLKQELVENPDFFGGWTGEDFECTFYGVENHSPGECSGDISDLPYDILLC